MDDFKKILKRIKDNDPDLKSFKLICSEVGNRFQELANALKTNKYVESIGLFSGEDEDNRNKISKAFADVIKKNTPLKTLDLLHCKIKDEGVKYLADALEVNTNLIKFNFSGNIITEQGAKYLADAIRVNASLESLNLVDNKIEKEGAKELAGALGVNTSLKFFSIANNDIGNEGAKYFSDSLKSNLCLEYLELSNIGIEKIATQNFLDLITNNRIQGLNLSCNGIGDQEVQVLANELSSNTALLHFKLLNIGIGDEGAGALANALKTNKALQSLNLSRNQIGNRGVKDLAELLEVNANITDLNLKYNQIGNDGAEALAEALLVNTNLTNLNLGRNKIGEIGAKALEKALSEKNRTLTKLDFDHNYHASTRVACSISSLALRNKELEIPIKITKKIYQSYIQKQEKQGQDQIAPPDPMLDPIEKRLIATSPSACEVILALLLEKDSKFDFDYMKGFKDGLTILFNCKDSEVFKSLKIKNPLNVNDLFKRLGVLKIDPSKKTSLNEIFSGDAGAKILDKLNAEDIKNSLNNFNKDADSGSQQTPSPSPLNPSRLFSWITSFTSLFKR